MLFLVSRTTSHLILPVAILVIGANLHRLSILGHDLIHYSIFKRKFLNLIIANLFVFYPLGACAEGYQGWHFRHHRNTANDDDPELAIKSGFFYSMPKTRLFFIAVFLLDCVGLGSVEVIKLIIEIRPKSYLHYIPLILFWGVVGLSAIHWGYLKSLEIYILTIFTSFWAFFRVRNWSEHIGIKGTHRFHAPYLARYGFFPFNTWYHYEHHAYPGVNYQDLKFVRIRLATPSVLTLKELFVFFEKSPEDSPKHKIWR
jgi:fatty acid desaturase